MDEEPTFSAIRARMSILSRDLEINSVNAQGNTSLHVSSSKSRWKSGEKCPEKVRKECDEMDETIIRTSRVSIKSIDEKTETLEISQSCTQQIKDKGRPVRARPPVPQKPKNKSLAVNSTSSSHEISLLATSKNESVVIDNKPINVSTTTKSTREEQFTDEQQTSSVNKLRLQFEQQTNLQKSEIQGNINSGRPRLQRISESPFAQTSRTTKISCGDDIKAEPQEDDSYAYGVNKGVSLLHNFKQQEFVDNGKQMPTKEIQSNYYSTTTDVAAYEDVIYENIDLAYPPEKDSQVSWHVPTSRFRYNYSGTAKAMSNAFILEEQCQEYYQQVSANQTRGTLLANQPRQVFVEDDLDDEFEDEFDDELPSQEPIYSNYEYAINSSSALQDLPRLPSENPRQRSSYAEAFTTALIRPKLKLSMSFNQAGQVRNQLDQNRTKCKEQLDNIMEELIKTEENYVQTLLKGITDYITNMFTRKDLPRNLQGKQFHLFGTIEAIAAFHRDILLPMFLRNRNNPKALFEEFFLLIKNRYLYNYVLYTMNRRRSQEIVDKFSPYFAYIQEELGEKLGIGSFLLQPVQRLPRYALLLKEFLKTLFTANISKEHLQSCCALENGIRKLLYIADEADKIVDIINWDDLNLCNPSNEFRKVLELYIFDLEHHRGYSGKVFVFEKFMIYTEVVSNKDLVYRGCYDALKKIDLIPTKNSFRMSQRGGQVLEFRPNSSDSIQHSLKFIEAMIDCNNKDVVTSNHIDCNIRQNSTYRNSDGSNRSDSGLGWDKDYLI